jgi:hypothetical protein
MLHFCSITSQTTLAVGYYVEVLAFRLRNILHQMPLPVNRS